MCKKSFFKVFVIATAVLGTISCSKDLYDEGKANETKQAEFAASEAQLVEQYKANFEKKYGKIDPNQTWDFSTSYETFFTSSAADRTRPGGGPGAGGPGAGGPNPGERPQAPANPVSKLFNPDQWYEVPEATLGLMGTIFGEGRDNTNKLMDGTFFEMTVPENDFYIMPIFMGQSGGKFELYISIHNGEDAQGNPIYADYKVWSKWDDLQYKLANDQNWRDVKKDNNGGYNTTGATAIRTKPLKISVGGLPKGKMQFYLKITEQASIYNKLNDKLGCVNGFIKEYPFNAGEVNLNSLPGIDANSTDPVQCKFFGCEDASTDKSDKDFNDVVFLCYGQPHTPESTTITEYSRENTKRYMIEDLGDADDRDFNDIVVDVVETQVAKVELHEDGTPLNGYENPHYETTGVRAEIRALGGTLDFELTIGKTKWKKSDNMPDNWTEMVNTASPKYNLEPLFTYPVTGYDAELNNISLKVFLKDGTETFVREVNFGKKGGVPMIIAVDPDQEWSVERGEFPFEEYLISSED